MAEADAGVILLVIAVIVPLGAMLLLNGVAYARINGNGIRRLSELYGERITSRAAAASTPRTIRIVAVGWLLIGAILVVMLITRLDRPAAPAPLTVSITLGAVEILAALILMVVAARRRPRADARSGEPSEQRRLPLVVQNAIALAGCGALTVISAALIIA